MTDTGQELAVKKAAIDEYVGATRGGGAKAATAERPRKLADWEYVRPPSGRKYTGDRPKPRAKKGARKR